MSGNKAMRILTPSNEDTWRGYTTRYSTPGWTGFKLIGMVAKLLSVCCVLVMVKLTGHQTPGQFRSCPSQHPRKAVNILFRLFVVVIIPATYALVATVGRFIQTSDQVKSPQKGTGRQLLWAEGANCTAPAIEEFPGDVFTREQRAHGALILHVLFACYLFVLLAVTCDDYFVPAIKKLCAHLRVSDDVAGATFMAAATSSPELFINLVGTFVTEGDLGVGTIVGSAVFNVLAVPACCGLFAGTVVMLDWWPVTRDCVSYGLTVVVLIFILQDGTVDRQEALVLVLLYLGYLLAMCFNSQLSRFAKRSVSRKPSPTNSGENTPLLKSQGGDTDYEAALGNNSTECARAFQDEDDDTESEISLSSWPKDSTFWGIVWWLFVWPITLLLYLTVPDCRQERWRNCYPVTFLLCIIWIAITSYLVAWMITVIGDTLQIPDSVMGLTFLAAGMSTPEAVSSVIVTKQGHGAMGISNSLGSNVFDILLCLGLPWFIKATFFPTVPGENIIHINSHGITYSSISLLSTLVLLYVTLAINRFKLDWKVGLACLVLYGAFLIFASLLELNVFFVVNLPTCRSEVG